MAIYSSVAPPSQTPAPSESHLDIETWTATSAVAALTISPAARGTGVMLSIPLDTADEAETRGKGHKVRKEPVKRDRDSMKRRDALLKGKEGSRRRQRWENGIWPSSP